jgi:hypothetical protein
MNQIDWKAAPEWADRHGYASSEAAPVWLSDEKYCYVDGRQYGRSFSFSGREGWAREQIKGVSTRPVEWLGVGDPPIGTLVVDWSDIGGPAYMAEVVAIEDGLVALKRPGSLKVVDLHAIKPVRTPKQIESEKRMASAYAMCAIAKTLSNTDAVALYDAGFLKQEAEK